MALSRQDVYSAAHCAIRPLLLFRRWEDVSRAIIGVNVWWECVELSPHHFRAAQAHARASRPEMALSRQGVYSAAHTAPFVHYYYFVISHFEGVVMGELDLRLESSAASEFAANTQGVDAGFQLPAVKWPLSGRRVMTPDWAEGAPLGDNEALLAAGHDLAQLGDRVLKLFLSHALRDGYFHGDMHQGNLKVAANGDIIAYDFGIMGHIDEYTRRVYAEILYGFIRRDYKRVAEVHFEAGYVPADRDVDEFARALRAVGEPIFGMDATQISMGRLLGYLFEVTQKFGMETRTELILLQRTMVVVEGVARSLNPQINIWQVARPVVEDYIRKRIGPLALLRDLSKAAGVLARFGPRLPGLVEAALIQQSAPAQEAAPHSTLLRVALFSGAMALGGALVYCLPLML